MKRVSKDKISSKYIEGLLTDQQKQVQKELLKTKSELYETNFKNKKLKQKYS